MKPRVTGVEMKLATHPHAHKSKRKEKNADQDGEGGGERVKVSCSLGCFSRTEAGPGEEASGGRIRWRAQRNP